jgi:two-component system, OmpR family, sensor kinase
MTVWQRLVGDRPIVTRLVVAVAVAMTAVLVASAAFVYWRVNFALTRQLNQDLDAYQQIVEKAVRGGTQPPSGTPGETFQVYDARGRRVLGENAAPPLVGRQVLAAARQGREQRVDVGSFLPVPAHAYRVVVARVRSPRGLRVVVSAISRRKHDEALRELLLQLTIADLLALVAASFVGYRTARAALDPVEGYRRAVEDVGDDLGRRLPVDAERDDELTRLGHTFNELLARIEAGSLRERQFLADASHDLRSPLSLMRTELEWALMRPRSDAELHTVLVSLQGQVHRLVELANALLDLEELRSGTLLREPTDLDELVADTAARFAVTARAAGTLVEACADGSVVAVNRLWLDRALGNLVDNALRHGQGPVRISAAVEGDRLVLAVDDAGPGFTPEFVGGAFERFTRAEESRTTEGSGLGLALVRAVAEAHGGSAQVDAGAEHGRVVLDLPLVNADDCQPQAGDHADD